MPKDQTAPAKRFSWRKLLPQDEEGQLRLLVGLRYALPLVWALALLTLSFFHNVNANSLGELSLWRLLFNTVKTARAYLLGDVIAADTESYYILLLVGAVVALVAFLAALFFAVFAFYSFVRAQLLPQGSEERKGVLVLFRALIPNRIMLMLANWLLVLTALYPHYFSLVSNQHPGGGFMTLGASAPLIVSVSMAILTLALSVFLLRRERGTPCDLFFIGDADEEEQVAVHDVDGEAEDEMEATAEGSAEETDNARENGT